MKGLAVASLALLAKLVSASITVTGAFASDDAGQPLQPKLGESFYMTATLKVDSAAPAYRVTFRSPFETLTTPVYSLGGDATVIWGPFRALLPDGESFRVSVENEPGAQFTVFVAPKLPNAGIEYFNPRALSASVGATVSFLGGDPTRFKWWIPQPSSGGYQQLLASIFRGSVLKSAPFGMPLIVSSVPDAQFELSVSSARSNPGMLRSVPWNAYRSLPAGITPYLRSERLVESTSSDVARFVSSSLPRNFRTSLTPYDTAQRLFQATVARLQYVANTGVPGAVKALRTGRGDCGFFTALFVASCRNAGIPARAATGMVVGSDNWHVWAEFYVPTMGWVPVDPSYCDGLCPSGTLPLYFGTIPELNTRVALSYGFDHVVGSTRVAMLQSPALVYWGSSKILSVVDHAQLAPASGN